MAASRYHEPRDRSAELLRLALAQMGRHDASFNPATFTIWYEYVGGINPRLSTALDQLVSEGKRIDDAAVAELHAAHVAPADRDSMERISDQMQRLMSGLAQSATQTGTQAGTFGEQLGGLTSALAAQDPAALAPWLEGVAASTAEMKTSVDSLRERVAQGEGEIRRLRDDLDRASVEALLDPLTGILNRKGFDRRMQAMLALPREGDTGHFLVMLDIDHFKKVNDTHGHVMGDRVIQGVAEVLRNTVSNPAHAVARYGGEEFAVLLPQSSRRECVQLAEAVRVNTRTLQIRVHRTQEVLVSVTISGGVTELRAGDDATSFVARADAALYQSKRAGRDCVTYG